MLKECKHCNMQINSSVRYCPFCGGDTPVIAPTVIPACPICACTLEENEYRGSVVDICPQCNGLWLDTTEFDYHSSERDTFNDETIPRKFTKQMLNPKTGYIKCVRCESVMARTNFKKISGVVIDVCRDHGVWLDSGELEQIRTFIANGGLNKSQDREISKNSIEISRVARETKELKTVFRTINKFNFKRILLQGF